LIDESEIGLAILFSSTKENCNPNKSDEENNIEEQSFHKLHKIGSQTQTNTLFLMNETNDTQTNQKSHYSDIIDSLAIQFEKKVQDIMIVTDTPEKNEIQTYSFTNKKNTSASSSKKLAKTLFETTSPGKNVSKISPKNDEKRIINTRSKNTLFNSSPVSKANKFNDFDLLKDDDFDFRSSSENSSSNKTIKQKKKDDKTISLPSSNSCGDSSSMSGSLKASSIFESIDDSLEIIDETSNKNKKIKTLHLISNQFETYSYLNKENHQMTRKTVLPSINKSESQSSVQEIPIKTEPSVSVELLEENSLLTNKEIKPKSKTKREPAASSNQLTDSSIVYSKLKPPPCSMFKSEAVKNEMLEQSAINCATSQVKVTFEPLIKQRMKNELLSSGTGSDSNLQQRINFKKFRKVPKASQLPKKESKNSNQSMFKRIKSEPFDVNSQFELFMSSMK
jgi:hypothetical protein